MATPLILAILHGKDKFTFDFVGRAESSKHDRAAVRRETELLGLATQCRRDNRGEGTIYPG